MLKQWIIAASVALTALVAGCSVALKFGYHQGPTLMYWWMDGYADLNDAQKALVKARIDQWFRWNRKDELPRYAELLDQFAAQVTEPRLPPEAFCAAAEEVKQRTIAAYEQAVPSLAEVAITLSPDQLKHMEKRFEKNNAKFRDDFIFDRREDRVKARAKKTIDNFERVYGSLDRAQRERVLQAENLSPYDPELWLGERRALQQEILQRARELQAARAAGAGPLQLAAQAQLALRHVAQHAEHSPREAYALQQQKVWNYNCQLAAQIHATMSPQQREHAQAQLREWEADVKTLNAGG